MSIALIIVGAGGFGRETLDVVEAINAASPVAAFDVLGVVDASPSALNLARLAERRIPWLGTFDELSRLARSTQFLIGVGSPQARERIAAEMTQLGFTAGTAIHPAAQVGSASSIDAGSVICAGAQVSTNVTLGKHVHVNPNATIGHDTILESFVSINPGAIVSGDVVVEERALVGAGAVVLQGLRVGSDSLVGASACVVRDVPRACTVKGVPAK